MITANVKRFIELQTVINDQITTDGDADSQLVMELDSLSHQLTSDEIGVLSIAMEDMSDEMEYEDIEWMIQ